MSIILIRVLFFCLIPVGIFVLVKGIKLVRKSFNGAILLEMPYLQGSGQFSVTEAGDFSIWHKAPLYKRTPLHQYRPHIYNTATNEQLPVSKSYFGMQSNDFSEGRMEIFNFVAPVGTYTLKVEEGTSLSGLQIVIANVIPPGNPDLSKHFLQIRKTQPKILAFLAIPVIILGAGGIIGGFVIGLLADQLF
jgi:hypothetical protein